MHTRQGTREVIAAYDLATGARLWQEAYDAPYQMNPAAQQHGPGPKSTPAVAGGRVFALGISGVLTALDLATGQVLWRVPAATTLPLYGTANSPVVDGDRVIAFMGGHDRGALTAFDAATGAVRWRWTGDGPGYSSPIVAELGGTRQVITQSQSRLVGVGAADGRLLWDVPLRTSFDQNSITPLVSNGLVISSGLETPTIAYRITRGPSGWQAQEAWRNEQVSMYMSSPAATGQGIFGLSHRNRGQFVALDPASGKTLWSTRGREADNASFIRAGEWLLIGTTNSELIVVRASAARFEEVDALHGRGLHDVGAPGRGRPNDRRKGCGRADRMECRGIGGPRAKQKAEGHTTGQNDETTGDDRGDGRCAGGIGSRFRELARVAGSFV